jgi:5-oxoprolinase (ATP-hydrolysing)
VSLSGGSGFGDPRPRPLAAVAHDLAEGFITAEGAARDYGAVVGRDGSIDAAASGGRSWARRRNDGGCDNVFVGVPTISA